MVDLQITDTGMKYVGDAAAAASEIIAKGDNGVAGTALTLYGAEVSFDFGVGGDNSPAPGMKRGVPSDTSYDRREWAYADIQQNAIESPSIKVTGVWDATDQDHMIAMGRLVMMHKTKGYKTLGSEGTYSANPLLDFAVPMINYIKYDNPDEDSADHTSPSYLTTISSINVRITHLTIKHSRSDSGKINYTLSLTELGKRFS